MAAPILRDDALTARPDGFELRLSLPWIRSMPLACVTELSVVIGGARCDVAVALGDREIPPADLAREDAWWFLQDRLVLRGSASLGPGAHRVEALFRLVVPYLAGGPDGPLVLPLREERELDPSVHRASASRDVSGEVAPTTGASPAAEASIGATGGPSGSDDAGGGAGPAHGGSPISGTADRAPATTLPDEWRLSANAFNWTPDVVRAHRTAHDIVVGIVADGVASVIEVEPGQVWPAFPAPSSDDVLRLRNDVAAVGGSVSMVGASIDDWVGTARRRDDDERLAFLLPQLRAASLVGAEGVRLPLGHAGRPLLERLLPVLEELDLVLYEEVQGQQAPSGAAFDDIADLDDPRLRVLVDTSMLMPALPVTYLERMTSLPAELHARLREEWRDPATHEAMIAALRGGSVPPELRTTFMNLIVRFGRSTAADLRPILSLVGAVHLKFWDLDDTDGRVSTPIRELGSELARSGFAGALCSEWGGHDWLDADATDMTRAHLALARQALAEGAAA